MGGYNSNKQITNDVYKSPDMINWTLATDNAPYIPSKDFATYSLNNKL